MLEVHEILVEADVVHALCGGIAANLYRAEIRATTDVDFYILVASTQLVALTREFEGRGWKAHPFWRANEQLRLEKDDTPHVDCLIAATGFERAALQRTLTAPFEGRPIPVLSPEDLIVFKLVAARARDYEAVAAIINTGGRELDVPYIKSRLEELDISDRWVRAREEAARERDD
jgi:hypothetical protein